MKETSIYNIPKVIRPKITWEFIPALDGTTILGKSMTVPDQTLSLKDILERYTMGADLPKENEGFYSDNPDLDDMDMMSFNRLDISEKTLIIEEIQRDQKRAVEKLQQEAKEKAEKEEQELAKKTPEKQPKKETPKIPKKEG